MSVARKTGPRVPSAPSTGPRPATPQPATPPTKVRLGNDRMLLGAREVDIAQLHPDPEQPRTHMNPRRLAELAGSIAAHGVLQPLVVRQDGLSADGDMQYTIIAGARRHAAIALAVAQTEDEETRRALTRVPVVLSQSAEAERRVLQLIENLQRENLRPVEEARALKEIMRLENLTTTGIAARIHRSQGYIDERLRLLRHEEVEDAAEAGLITTSAAAAIASLTSAEARHDWLERAQRGEKVAPQAVYQSKPNRRRPRRSLLNDSELRSEAALSPGPAVEARAQALRGAEPALSAAEARQLAAAESEVASSGVADGPLPGFAPPAPSVARQPVDEVKLPNFGNARRILTELNVPFPDVEQSSVVATSRDRHAYFAALLDPATAHERALVRRVLTVGVMLGMSCEDALRAIHPTRQG
jgi:ParB family chromosome partitioning protein